MSAYLLGVDLGTSACKAALFDEAGRAMAQTLEEYEVYYPHPGWAEQDPDEWWGAICKAIRRVMEAAQVNPADIAGVGVDGQGWSAIAVDKEGQVLCPTPIWTDTRSTGECGELLKRISGKALFDLCGNPLQPTYTLPKILWYQKNRPDVYKNTAYILQSNSFIVYRLTGKISQDVSQSYGFNCFNMRKGVWDLDMARRIGIKTELLPPIFACHEEVGRVTAEAAALTGLREGTPVVAGGLDAACGTLGAGVIENGDTQEQGGQAGGMSICLDHYSADERLILGYHVVPGRWLLQGGSTGGGGALKWLRQTLCPELTFEDMTDLAGAVAPGSDGVIFLPYMSGERSPIWNPKAKGVFFGLDYAKGRGQMIRAVMEGVAYSLRHNLETAQEAGANVAVLRAMGGSANSLVWTQLKADITNKKIEVAASDTATSLGAAILAGVGTGVYGTFREAVQKTVQVSRVHTPDAETKKRYDREYPRYRQLYTQLEIMMK